MERLFQGDADEEYGYENDILSKSGVVYQSTNRSTSRNYDNKAADTARPTLFSSSSQKNLHNDRKFYEDFQNILTGGLVTSKSGKDRMFDDPGLFSKLGKSKSTRRLNTEEEPIEDKGGSKINISQVLGLKMDRKNEWLDKKDAPKQFEKNNNFLKNPEPYRAPQQTDLSLESKFIKHLYIYTVYIKQMYIN